MKKRFNNTDRAASWLIREKLQWIQDAIDTGSPWLTPGTIERDVDSVRRLAREADDTLEVMYMGDTITLEELCVMRDQLNRLVDDAICAIRTRTRRVVVRVPA